MAAVLLNTESIPGIKAIPRSIKCQASPQDRTKKEVCIIAEAGTSSKDMPFAVRGSLDSIKRSYLDTFLGGFVSCSEWGQLPAKPSMVTPLEELERLVDRVEHKFINTEYDYPEIISRVGYLLITSRRTSHREILGKEGSQLKTRKISPKEAYELAQKTRMSYKEKWRTYAKEEARRLSLFESDD